MNTDTPIFEYQFKVRDYECDAQGIVNNANYQHYYEMVRHEFLEAHGLNFYEQHKQGIDAVVASVHIKYKTPLYGSDVVKGTINIERKGVRYIFHQKIYRVSDNKLCNEAKYEIVTLYNGKLGKPEVFDKAFAQYLGEI